MGAEKHGSAEHIGYDFFNIVFAVFTFAVFYLRESAGDETEEEWFTFVERGILDWIILGMRRWF